MTHPESIADGMVVLGASAGTGPGYTLEAVAVRLAEDIAELRADGGIPAYVHTVITVLPRQRVLEIQVEGLSIDADPDRTTIRQVTNTLFEIASFHNIIALDATTPPLFTQRILLLDTGGRPFHAMLGAGIGDVEDARTVTQRQL